jgi:ribosomal-protein-alanine N-acetyltransferase
MKFTLRAYEAADFEAISVLDRECFPPGIAYTRRMLRRYLAHPGADCLVAYAAAETSSPASSTVLPSTGLRGTALAGFIVAEQEGAEAHIITLDVAEAYRRAGTGTALLVEMERQLAERGVKRVTLETAVNNEAGVAFWQRHGYSTAGVFKRYYLERLDAYYMVKALRSSDARSAQGHAGSG